MKIRWAAFLVTLLACAPAFAKNEPVTLFFDLSYNGFKIAEVTETLRRWKTADISSKATPSPSVCEVATRRCGARKPRTIKR